MTRGRKRTDRQTDSVLLRADGPARLTALLEALLKALPLGVAPEWCGEEAPVPYKICEFQRAPLGGGIAVRTAGRALFRFFLSLL